MDKIDGLLFAIRAKTDPSSSTMEIGKTPDMNLIFKRFRHEIDVKNKMKN
ncbi:hypothetical protein [Anaerosolibacter carboniphilus]|nr:hypothetical protein [Anaerosolibacter carboniphilus]